MARKRNIYLHVERLRARYGADKYKIPFPDLKVEARTAPCSNRFDPVQPHANPEPYTPPHGLIVDHLHKSSLQVILPSELPWAGGKKP